MGRLIDCNDVYNAIQITTDNFGVIKGVVESNMLAMLSKIETVEAIPKDLGKEGYEDCVECASEHRQLAEWLKELKQLREQSRWTPVSERSPEDSGEYLVSVIDEEDEDYKQVGVAWFAHPKDYDIQDGEWRELMIDEIVVAWMPLPKSYSEVEK